MTEGRRTSGPDPELNSYFIEAVRNLPSVSGAS